MINQLLCTVHSLHCSVAESLHHAIFSYHANKATTEMMCHARQYAGSLTDHVVLHLQVAVMAGDPFILPSSSSLRPGWSWSAGTERGARNEGSGYDDGTWGSGIDASIGSMQPSHILREAGRIDYNMLNLIYYFSLPAECI